MLQLLQLAQDYSSYDNSFVGGGFSTSGSILLMVIITAMPNAVETVAMRIMIRAREARPLRAVRSANMYSKLMGRHISL